MPAARGEARATLEEAIRSDLAGESAAGCRLWQWKVDGNGYGIIKIEGKNRRVTRLILEACVGPAPEDKPFALHGRCNNPTCFALGHLRWGSSKENAADMEVDGTRLLGSEHPNSVGLSSVEKSEIERMTLEGVPQRAIAKLIGVDRNAVQRYVNGARWDAGHFSHCYPSQVGENHHASVLSDSDVSEILKLIDIGGKSQRDIGEMFGVSQSHVSRIKRGKRRNSTGGV